MNDIQCSGCEDLGGCPGDCGYDFNADHDDEYPDQFGTDRVNETGDGNESVEDDDRYRICSWCHCAHLADEECKDGERTGMTPYDFKVESHGSIILVIPQNDWAKDWLYEHIHEPQWFGGGIAVELRFIGELCEGIIEEGGVISAD